jgi:hypothetical protein
VLPSSRASVGYLMMKMRGRFTGAVAATMRQQFACSAFRSRTSILIRLIGNAAFGADIPASDGLGQVRCRLRPGFSRRTTVAYLTGAQAAGSWCAFYDASTYNCGFHSFEQCRETVLGAGGWCRPNFFEDRPGGQRNRAR